MWDGIVTNSSAERTHTASQIYLSIRDGDYGVRLDMRYISMIC